MIYTKDDLVKLSWDDFENYSIKIQQEVKKYLDKNNLHIDIVAPILRGGGILAIQLAFAFRTIRILPYQYKYFHNESNLEAKKMYDSDFGKLINFKKKDPVILVVEGNHSSGKIANMTITDIKRQLPDSKIIYVAMAKDYFYRDSVAEVDFTTCGYYTNENRELDEAECHRLKIEPNKVYIFPWETYEEELAMLNNNKFEYQN